MADWGAVGSAASQLGDKINLGGIGSTLTWIIIFMVILVVSGIIVALLLRSKQYNYIIEIYEDLSGTGPKRIGSDKARLVKTGSDGTEMYYLQKHKIYRQGYGKKIGINRVAFCIGSDGFWYNIVFKDFDKSLGEVGLKPVDKDIRSSHVNNIKAAEREYSKVTFLERYGGIIAFSTLCIILGVSIWLGTWNQLKASDSLNAGLVKVAELTEKQAATQAQVNEALRQSAEANKAAANVLINWNIAQASNSGSLRPA